MMADSHGANDPELQQHINEATALSESISEMLRNSQLELSNLLDDPSALLEVALAPDNPLLMGTGAVSMDPSNFLHPQTEYPPKANPDTQPPSTVCPPHGDAGRLNPPLSVPDISQFSSVSMSTLLTPPEKTVTHPTLNPPIRVPDISHFVHSPPPAVTDCHSPSVASQIGKAAPEHSSFSTLPLESETAESSEGSQLEQSQIPPVLPLSVPDDSIQLAPLASTSTVTSCDQATQSLTTPRENTPSILQSPTESSTQAATATQDVPLMTDSASSVIPVASQIPTPVSMIQPNGQQTTTTLTTHSATVSLDQEPTATQDASTSAGLLSLPAQSLPGNVAGTPPTSDQATQSSASLVPPAPSAHPSPLPKGLNLPLLQFLQINFPKLRIDNLKDILQVNALLTHALQQQQQQLQQQIISSGIQITTVSPSQPTSTLVTVPSAATPKPTQIIRTKLAAPIPSPIARPMAKTPTPPPKPASSKSLPPTTQTSTSSSSSSSSRPPVFVQIIRNKDKLPDGTTATQTQPQLKGTPIIIPTLGSGVRLPRTSLTSPLILQRQNKLPNIIHSTLASIPMRPSRVELKSEMRRTMVHTPRSSKMLKTLIQPADSEPMEVDVGQPVQRLEYPPHLKDHTYCIYNPEEGDTIARLYSHTGSIPPVRLSYAPQVPDSPTTLYKLMKVLPRKITSRSTSRTSTPRSGTPKGRSARGKVKGKVREGSKIPSSRPESEESSYSSELSDGDDESSQRRRSQRNVGQRKHYVDDIHLPLSDEELLEDMLSVPVKGKRYYKGYGDEEESDYDDIGGPSRNSAKHKSRTITVNPTEGFQYSDVYFEPPAEEANLVERILSDRMRETKTEEEKEKYGEKMEEFLIKYKNYSYLHTEWATFAKLLQGDKRFDGKVKRYKTKQQTYGFFANVDDEPFNPEYTVVDRILDVATQAEPNGELVTHYLVKWRALPYEDSTWELEENVDSEKIRQFNLLHAVPPADELTFCPRPRPSAFKPIKGGRMYKEGNHLRPYQQEGLNWLVFNWYTRQNCILADEMGLGKTVQSIVFLLEVFNAGIRGPFLVIAPLSTITNWQREFESWSDFNLIVYHGSAYSRRLIHEYELYYRDTKGKVVSEAFKFNVIVTTYEVILSDDSELQNIQWRVVIIDEAHRLKNRNCKLLEGLKTLNLEHRVLLTGTPLQNSVDELFSLLNFLEPSTFPSHLAFLQQFGDLKTEEQVKELKTILKPMMLRRLKEDVEKSIAPKEETIVEVELTVIQKQYYRAILERNFTFLSKGGSNAGVPSLLNVMMELRKCCNHPFLIKGAEIRIVLDFQKHHPNQPATNALIQASGKLVLIDKLLPKLKENGHKVLIFSQMVRCLDILEDYLRMKGYFYERIDGQVRGTLRQAAIDRFSKPDSDRFVFLLCTRAGGLGINLTAADTVIIYDSDWNPQNDIQAQARCHRIGQSKAVKVYRLITRNSYEREMFDRASLKLGLDKAVLQSMDTQQTTGPPQLSKKEIEDLLKKGAYGTIMEEDDDANKFCEEDIDQILERRTCVIQLETEGKGSTFSKASFAADGSSDLNIDDPDFWQKWAERAKLNLEELANKDSLVIDTPRQRRQVRRYGNESLEEIVDMSETMDEVMDILPSRGRRGWTRLECFKVEKWLLIYGWGQCRDITRAARFKKRQLGVKDVENIARTMLVYCVAHFKGDEKVTPYIHQLIDPSEITEPVENLEDNYFDFTEDDYLALLTKDPETLFPDESYKKHLRRHSTRILLRVRQLHIIRWSILAPYIDRIKRGTPVRTLGLSVPKPEEPPPVSWWNVDCDHSLLVAIVKHGYEQFRLWRSDPALCFRALVGEEPPHTRKKKLKTKTKAPSRGGVDYDDEDEEMSGMESEGEGEGEGEGVGEGEGEESAPSTPRAYSTPVPGGRKTRSTGTNTPKLGGGAYLWPSLADVNTRARRLVNAWLKLQRREEQRLVQLQRERDKRERVAEASRKKQQKKAELAQKWSKREEQDFVRVISFFGVIFNEKANRYNWTKFRQLANLSKKSDERLTLYLHDFKQMCWRVLKKKPVKRGLCGFRMEAITEERATRCLQRIELLLAVRQEIIPHPDFEELIKLCELSFEVPHWWLPVDHDRDLLRGVAKHGLYRSDQLIYNDPELSFKETVPQTALFDPNLNQVVQEEEEVGSGSGSGSDEDSDGPKLRSSGPLTSKPVPLGWPKEKAIVIRMTRIVYAFRNRVWPKPMEGLDLFSPVVNQESSSSESESEGESDVVSDSDYEVMRTGGRSLTLHITTKERAQSPVVDVEGDASDRDFEIQKQQGLKLTLKKSSHPARLTPSKAGMLGQEPLKSLEIKIPLVKLTFASKAGLKRIPKKRPADRSAGEDSPDPKKRKRHGSPALSKIAIVDPTKINFTDLTGRERVGVINRNTGEMLPLKQSPSLKTLEMWLEGHPHYNVDCQWGQLVLEWGALKPEMYQRILQVESSPPPPEYEPVSD